jgi:hypothetical protein
MNETGFQSTRRLRGPVRALLLIVVALLIVSFAWHLVTGLLMPLLWLAVIAAVVMVAVRRLR